MSEQFKKFHPSEIPSTPGVYVHRDRFGKVIYVGKAKNLRKRLSQYFQPSQKQTADARRRSLLNSIFSWEYYEVKNEDEALLLESRLIKQYAPYYNVLMRDDKRYLLLKLDKNSDFPTLKLARVHKDDSAVYFGPFPRGGALKSTLEFLLAHFGLRACRDANPNADTRKRCLKRIVKDCLAPCTGEIDKEAYQAQVKAMLKVLNGDISGLLEELDLRMTQAATNLRFEKAANLRDIKSNLIAVFGRKNRNFRHATLPTTGGEEAVKALQEALHLPTPPNHVECFDISNILGQMAVASMVVFQNGKPAKNLYRRFRIKTVHQSDDFAMMAEVISRHFQRKLNENKPMPDLLVVDGGKGQLSSAIDTLVKLQTPAFPVIGLAKKHEEIFLPKRSEPIVLDHHHLGLRMLQALRDESHRFAISYHRSLRHARLSDSLLDEIPNIGKVRKQQLLKSFGSVRALRRASVEDIVARVPAIGISLAQDVHTFLQKKNNSTPIKESEKNV